MGIDLLAYLLVIVPGGAVEIVGCDEIIEIALFYQAVLLFQDIGKILFHAQVAVIPVLRQDARGGVEAAVHYVVSQYFRAGRLIDLFGETVLSKIVLWFHHQVRVLVLYQRVGVEHAEHDGYQDRDEPGLRFCLFIDEGQGLADGDQHEAEAVRQDVRIVEDDQWPHEHDSGCENKRHRKEEQRLFDMLFACEKRRYERQRQHDAENVIFLGRHVEREDRAVDVLDNGNRCKAFRFSRGIVEAYDVVEICFPEVFERARCREIYQYGERQGNKSHNEPPHERPELFEVFSLDREHEDVETKAAHEADEGVFDPEKDAGDDAADDGFFAGRQSVAFNDSPEAEIESDREQREAELFCVAAVIEHPQRICDSDKHRHEHDGVLRRLGEKLDGLPREDRKHRCHNAFDDPCADEGLFADEGR